MKTFLAAIALVIAGTAGAVAVDQAGTKPAFWMERPCHFEDSINCTWNAGGSGNHAGHSFYVRFHHDTLCVFYAQRPFAKHHDFCRSGVSARTSSDLDMDGAVE